MSTADAPHSDATPAFGLQSRRTFLGTGFAAISTVALASVLTACGDDDASSTDSSTDSSTASTTAPAPDTTAITPTTDAASTSAADTSIAATEVPASDLATTTTEAPTSYSVTHAYGTFDIPAQPQRVIAMENRRDLETAVVLGLPLAGVGTFGDVNNVAASFVPVDLTGVEIIRLSEINFEQLVSLQPDLILAREIYLDDGPGLAEVAPVLPIAADGSWRADLEQVAGWMHRETTLKSALDQYDALLAEVGERHADLLASSPIAIVEFYPADSTFYAGGLDDFQLQANTLKELGGSLIPFLTDRSYFDEPFSVENLNELDDAAAILVVAGKAEDRAALDALDLWQRVPAVTAGRVVQTDVRTNQGSVYAATECVRLLDELFNTLT